MGCNLCPRRCNTDRKAKIGFCSSKDKLRIARAALHFWEEPSISGTKGSGAVFFSGCSLKCVFCQNKKISSGEIGKDVSTNRLAEIFEELYQKGAHNINLVTPTHYADKIAETIKAAKNNGINIPFLYNTGGYDEVNMLRKLEGLIDIYMPDFKYISNERAKKYSSAWDYPDVAKKALDEMVRQHDKVVFDSDGIMQSGVLIRHMMLPGGLAESKKAMEYLYDKYGEKVYFSIMSQYTPVYETPFPELNQKTNQEEYEELVDFCISLGMENAYIQEGEAAEESFIPDFNCEGV